MKEIRNGSCWQSYDWAQTTRGGGLVEDASNTRKCPARYKELKNLETQVKSVAATTSTTVVGAGYCMEVVRTCFTACSARPGWTATRFCPS